MTFTHLSDWTAMDPASRFAHYECAVALANIFLPSNPLPRPTKAWWDGLSETAKQAQLINVEMEAANRQMAMEVLV